MNKKIFSFDSKGRLASQLRLFTTILAAIVTILSSACKKLVNIDPPTNSIRTDQVFASDIQAKSAMAGVYTLMINGSNLTTNSATDSYSKGLTTLIAGQSADELITASADPYTTNKLTSTLSYFGGVTWTSAYQTIYGANAMIEGIEASTSPNLHADVRKELKAEAKFLRAFAYIYLVNFFGDVPLVMTVDFNKTALLPRAPQKEVYMQIIQDLKDAQTDLPTDYSNAPNGERIIPNKWAATALLARAYLYSGDYTNAAVQSSSVIANTAQYSLVSDPNKVFLKNSTEAIWQLQQNVNITYLGNSTPEQYQFTANPEHTGIIIQYFSDELKNSFTAGDKRRTAWVDSTNQTIYGGGGSWYYYPYKYKIGSFNFVAGAPATEYYMVLRLAEQYLIRAEAEYRGVNGGAPAAVVDLNIIRTRAGLPNLSASLSGTPLLQALAHERQIEFFCEWGHRWFDIRRLGIAHDVLSNIPRKQPWAGDYQFLYPIPLSEMNIDHNLTQNPGYN